MKSIILLTTFFAALAAVSLWPQIDLAVAGYFHVPGHGFPLARQPALLAIHGFATKGSWVIGAALALAAALARLRKSPVCGIDGKGWLFLFLALVIGPGLVANIALKDHWGRARPYQVTEFGGAEHFSPALEPQPNPRGNGSFVAGDAAFGFFLSSFAYVVRRHRRLAFWTGMGIGALLGLMRIAMGGHFLSDVLCACLVTLAPIAALHAALYGFGATKARWKEWFQASPHYG